MNILLVYFGIFIAILLIAMAVKIIKGAIKIAFFVTFVVFLFLFVSGYFVIQDAKEFKERFPEEETVYLMTVNESVVAGFSIEGFSPEGAEFFTQNDLNEYTTQYNEDDFDINDTYKIFVVDYEAFNETLEEGVSYEGVEINTELADEMFNSADPATVLAKEINEEQWYQVREQLVEDIGLNTEIKGAVFAVMVMKGFREPQEFILKNIKTGELEVYPETAMFTTIRLVPEAVYEKIISEEDGMEVLGEG